MKVQLAVIPAEAGIQSFLGLWIPAFAGMTYSEAKAHVHCAPPYYDARLVFAGAHVFDYIKYPHFVALLIAFIFADAACAIFGRLARRAGALDAPGTEPYKVQKEAVPFVGGFGILLGFVGALLLSLRWDLIESHGFQQFLVDKHTRLMFATVTGGLATALIGFVDDFTPINAVVKLVALGVLTAVLAQFGLIVNLTPWDAVNWLITLIWIVGIMSAFNAIDNTDGVAGVSAGNAAFWIFLIGWGTSAATAQASLSFMGIALLGAVLGFLRHNRPPARLYLGNGGAFLLGFLIAVSVVHAGWSVNDALKSAIAPMLLLAYPIFDLSYTVFMRWKQGIVRNPIQAIIVSGRDHTAHRLTSLGIPPWGVVFVIAGLNGIGGFAAYVIVRYSPSDAWMSAIVAGVAVVYACFGFVIRNAVDLRSEVAKISHRKPTGKTPQQRPTANV